MNESAPVREGNALDWLHEQGKRRARTVPEFDLAATLSKLRAARAADAYALSHSQPTEHPRRTQETGNHPPWGGQLCALFAVDIVGFTEPHRDDDIRLYLHEELYRLLEKAFDGSGIPWAACFHEDRGDGALIVVPPSIAPTGIIDPLPGRLRSLIRRHNHVSDEAAGIQVRAAAHIGLVDHDGHGFVSSDINLLFRMLDARPLKRALKGSGAELALIISDHVYRSVVCRYPSKVGPGAFQPVRFQVKNIRARAWTYIPGTGSG